MKLSNHIKDETGKVFSRITVISFNSVRGTGGHSYWNCQCSCGNKIIARGSHLRNGNIKSCHCYSTEKGKNFLDIYANSDLHKNEGNSRWVGAKAKYSTFHGWINKHNKKDIFCNHCNQEKKLDWAIKKGKKYSRDISDYLCLCRSCHLKYDYTEERKNKLRLKRV